MDGGLEIMTQMHLNDINTDQFLMCMVKLATTAGKVTVVDKPRPDLVGTLTVRQKISTKKQYRWRFDFDGKVFPWPYVWSADDRERVIKVNADFKSLRA